MKRKNLLKVLGMVILTIVLLSQIGTEKNQKSKKIFETLVELPVIGFHGGVDVKTPIGKFDIINEHTEWYVQQILEDGLIRKSYLGDIETYYTHGLRVKINCTDTTFAIFESYHPPFPKGRQKIKIICIRR
ncbi:MAG: hypothetical protein LBH96_03075 [Candidatus Peribacteria bacterium]|jgi:hypothetical protein|nr:hypothetical protein [Candidatus Peribacteria bacterium]